MKTTVDVADSLLGEAKRQAQAEGTTLRAFDRGGVAAAVAGAPGTDAVYAAACKLPRRRAHPDVDSWEEIRKRAYETKSG